ncbi:MAG: nicotinate (nicotinamide) nucleotide adenylyltransferase [Bacteroidales bacterium]|nr:nicotinate (nicotinamide) nucleotide adenylyltransferase [Bacteroidales bacterium]
MGSINQATVPETSVSGRRVGIFGGSFNPIHLGHIALAQAAIEQQLVDEVWLLVSPLNPLKVNKTLLPEEERLRLAEKALEGTKGIKASSFEFQLERPSYTWKTLEALEVAYPQHTFSLIIGADNWAIFDRWVKADLIRARYNIYVYPREGSEILPDAEGHMPTAIIDAPLYPFSSTDIRNAIAEGASDEVLATMLPKAIIDDCRRLYASTTMHH